MLFVYSDTDIPTISFYANNRDVNLPELALGLFCPGILKGKFCGLKKLQNQKISVFKILKIYFIVAYFLLPSFIYKNKKINKRSKKFTKIKALLVEVVLKIYLFL